MKGTCISSRGMYLTRPLTTVRGCGSPTSIDSTYNESASGCFSAFVIRPTRISSLLIEISLSEGAEALPFASEDFLGRSFFPVLPSVYNQFDQEFQGKCKPRWYNLHPGMLYKIISSPLIRFWRAFNKRSKSYFMKN